jgi:hypothetical protein
MLDVIVPGDYAAEKNPTGLLGKDACWCLSCFTILLGGRIFLGILGWDDAISGICHKLFQKKS